MTTDGDLKADQEAWRRADISGAEYEGFGTIPEGRQTSAEFRTTEAAQTGATVGAPDHRWDPPRYEIALQFGFLHYPTRQLEGVAVSLTSPNPELPPHAIGLSDNIDGGWRGGVSVTMNTWRWISSEFGYHIQRGKYRLEQVDIPGDIDEDLGYETYSSGIGDQAVRIQPAGACTPARIPMAAYVAVGPALQLIHLTDAPVKRAPKAFKLGLAKHRDAESRVRLRPYAAFGWRRNLSSRIAVRGGCEVPRAPADYDAL